MRLFALLIPILFATTATGVSLAHAEDRTLFLGDSHSAGSFGDGLRDGLFSLGITHESDFYQLSVSGSSATHWVYGRLKELKIDSTIKFPGQPKIHRVGALATDDTGIATVAGKIHPDRLIIALGTNDLFQYYETLHPGAIKKAREVKAVRSREPASISPVPPLDPLPPELEHDPMGRPIHSMRKLFRFNSNMNCTLILPPEVSKELIPVEDQDRFFSRLRDEALSDNCHVIDSRSIMDHAENPVAQSWKDCQTNSGNSHPLLADRKDGIHFSQSKGEYWGHCVALGIKETSK